MACRHKTEWPTALSLSGDTPGQTLWPRVVPPARLQLPLLDPQVAREFSIVAAHPRDEGSMNLNGSVFVDLASPVGHFAVSGWMRRHVRTRTLVISNRFFDVPGERLGDLISSRIAAQ